MKAASEIGQVLLEADKIKQGIDDMLKYVYSPGIGISFDLPKDTILVKSKIKDVITKEKTNITIEVNEGKISLLFYPFLFIDVIFPINNIVLKGIQYNFISQSIDFDVSYDSNIAGLNVIGTTVARGAIQTMIYEILKDTRILKSAGYSPLKDPDMIDTFNQVISKANDIKI